MASPNFTKKLILGFIFTISFVLSPTKSSLDKELYNISVQLSINEVSRVSENFSLDGKLAQILHQHIDQNTLLPALQTCRNFLSLALYDLNRSLLPTSDVLTSYATRTDFRTWLSAAETYLQTCMDSYEHAPNEVRLEVEIGTEFSISANSISDFGKLFFIMNSANSGSNFFYQNRNIYEIPISDLVLISKNNSKNYDFFFYRKLNL